MQYRMYVTNMETRDPVLPSSCTGVFYWCIWVVHHDLPSCFMAFYSCLFTLYAFFLNHWMQWISVYSSANVKSMENVSLCGLCCRRWSQWYCIRNPFKMTLSHDSILSSEVFISLFILFFGIFIWLVSLSCLSEHKTIMECCHHAAFSSWSSTPSVHLFLPSVVQRDVLAGVCCT